MNNIAEKEPPRPEEWEFEVTNFRGNTGYIKTQNLPYKVAASYQVSLSNNGTKFYIPNHVSFIDKHEDVHKQLLQGKLATASSRNENYADIIELLMINLLKARINLAKTTQHTDRQHKVAESYLKRHYTDGVIKGKSMRVEGKRLASFSTQKGLKLISASDVFRLTRKFKAWNDDFEEMLGLFESTFNAFMEKLDNSLPLINSGEPMPPLSLAAMLSQYDKVALAIVFASFHVRMDPAHVYTKNMDRDKMAAILFERILQTALPMMDKKWAFVYCTDAYLFPFTGQVVVANSNKSVYVVPVSPQLLIIMYDNDLPTGHKIWHPYINLENAASKLILLQQKDLYPSLISFSPYPTKVDFPFVLGMMLARQYLGGCLQMVYGQGQTIYWNPLTSPFGVFHREIFQAQASSRKDLSSIDTELTFPVVEQEVWLKSYALKDTPYSSTNSVTYFGKEPKKRNWLDLASPKLVKWKNCSRITLRSINR